MATLSPDGGHYDLTPPAVLLLVADAAYGDPSESTPAGRVRSQTFVDAMLHAAHEGGFKQCDILKTLLVNGEHSCRVRDMARSACEVIGNDAMLELFRSLRLSKGGLP
jgi:hypothetical protein